MITGSSAEEIAQTVEAAVHRGALAAGDRLPPVRALAARLAVSPTTVQGAYQRLRHRGVVVARARQGVRVASAAATAVPSLPALPPGVRDLASGSPDPALLPPLPELPPAPHRLYGEPVLLDAAAAAGRRLFTADGLDATELTLTSGAMDAVARVLDVWVRPGDRVVLEDPGYAALIDLVRTMALEPVPAMVDGRGLVPDALQRALATKPQAVVLTPRAHVPTGAALDEARAGELRRILADHPGVAVLEDDHAALIAGTPYAGTVGGRRRWAVARSVSKALGPDLRLAFLAGDPVTVRRVDSRQRLGPGWISGLLQRIVATQLADDHVRRTLDHARELYAGRRRALVDALTARGLVAAARSGVNVWVPVPEEAALVGGMLERGWAIRAGEAYRLATPPAVRITTAALPVDLAPQVAADLVALLAPGGRTRSA